MRFLSQLRVSFRRPPLSAPNNYNANPEFALYSSLPMQAQTTVCSKLSGISKQPIMSLCPNHARTRRSNFRCQTNSLLPRMSLSFRCPPVSAKSSGAQVGSDAERTASGQEPKVVKTIEGKARFSVAGFQANNGTQKSRLKIDAAAPCDILSELV